MDHRSNILVIEDDTDIRECLAALLELEGYEVFSAVNGKEGMQVLARMPPPCMILLDLMMPVMNGWEFLEAMRAAKVYGNVPVCVLSATTTPAKLPAEHHFMQKPLDFDGLLRMVHSSCASLD